VWDAIVDELLADKLAGKPSVLYPAIAALSDAYNRGTARPPRDRASLAARLAFFLRADLPKAGVCVAECRAAGVTWPSALRVLDAGAGLGAAGLGAVQELRAAGHEGPIHVVSLDDDAAALELGHALYKRAAAAGLGALTHEPRLWSAVNPASSLGAGPYDLILASALLCELGRPPDDASKSPKGDALVARLLGALAPDGVLVIIEPALRTTSRALLALRDRLAAGGEVTIVAPCTRSGPCPALADERDWCHEDRPFTPSPGLARLSAAMGLRRGGLKFSYLTLRKHGPTLGETSGLTRPERVVSEPLLTKGKLELWICGPDGRRRITRLKRDKSEANEALGAVRRGDLVSIDGLSESGRVQTAATVDRWRPA
jgi:ribosomal protein RSM22 (predicted rRNA methylase)